jgi:hypothetical protein
MEANFTVQTGAVPNTQPVRPLSEMVNRQENQPNQQVQPRRETIQPRRETTEPRDVAGSAIPTGTQPTVNVGVAEVLTIDIPVAFSDEEITVSMIERYVDNINHELAPSFFRLSFGVHEPTNRITVQVVDTNTNEILRELPPESRLDIIAKMQEFAGLLFDARS